MTKLHENENDNNDNNNNDNKFTHACIIAVFFLIDLFYLSIHLLNYSLRFIQFYLMFMNIMNFIIVFSLINYYLWNFSIYLIFSQCHLS